MSENIIDYGGIEGDDSHSAISSNINAINEASIAANDNTVYLPEGTWYIGAPPNKWGGFGLWPGKSSVDRGAAGLGFIGAGPDKTTLKWGYVKDGYGHTIRYSDDVNSHNNVVWRDLTYDGNYQNFDFSNEDTTQYAIRSFTELNATFENVRFNNHQMAGLRLGSGSVNIDRCTFHDIGIGRLNQTGQYYSHPVAQGSSDVEITNTKVTLSAGSLIDCTYGTSGAITIDNVYAGGIGTNLVKLNDATSVDISRVNYTGQTQELLDAQDSDNSREYNGRYFFRRQHGDSSAVPVTMHNILAVDTTRRAIRVANGKDIDLTGGTEGPIVFKRSSLTDNGNAAFQVGDSNVDFDVGELSVHDLDDPIYNMDSASGTIDTLRRDNTNGLGELSGVTIREDAEGENPFVPDVPSQDEVGANSDGASDSAPAVSWASPSEGDTVSGTITVQVDASDTEDSATSLTVEYRVDDGSWRQTSFDSGTGYHEASWGTTALADGNHAVEARATDSAGNTSRSTIDLSIDNSSPLFGEWTPQWESDQSDWSVVNDSSLDGGYALAFEPNNASVGRHAISCDAVDEPSDVEVLDKFRVSNIREDQDWSGHARVNLRSGTTPTDDWTNGEDAYCVDIGHIGSGAETTFRVIKYTDGDFTTLQKFGNPQENTFYYRRFRAEGSELKAKVWPAGEGEPSSWDVELTDTDHSSGWVGLGSYDPDTIETDVFSVATGGASAEYSGLDSKPTVSVVTPANGDTVSETVTIQIDASDEESDANSLTVEYRVDGGSWRQTTYNTDTEYHEANWDTTTHADGNHTLEVRATDSGGNTASTSVDVTTGNNPVIERFDITETSDSDWTSFDVDWSVSDSGEDLDTVVTTLEYQDQTVAAESTFVSDTTADGAHTIRVHGDVSKINLSVTDTANRVTEESKTV